MAEFKLPFEDGSNGYLAHHGVKGMHWGVWNAETQARYAEEGKTPPGGGLSDDDVDELEEARKRRDEDYDSIEDSEYLMGIGNDQDYKDDRRGNRLSYRYEGGSFGGNKYSKYPILARQKKGEKAWEHLTALGVTSKYVSDVSSVVNRKK